MLNIYDLRKAQKEIDEDYQEYVPGFGNIKLRKEGYYVYPELVITSYHRYINWLKTYKPEVTTMSKLIQEHFTKVVPLDFEKLLKEIDAKLDQLYQENNRLKQQVFDLQNGLARKQDIYNPEGGCMGD